MAYYILFSKTKLNADLQIYADFVCSQIFF